MHILLVEDNVLNQKILSFHLKKNNYSLDLSGSGEDAVEKYAQEWFEVILMDLMLPGMTGYETSMRIRMIEKEKYQNKKTYIIALTANTLDNEMERCFLSGMDGYLTKPFDMVKLDLIFESLHIGM